MKEWFLTSDLVGKSGMPDTPQGVTNKARNEEWKKRKAPGVKGRAFEYHRSSLPQSVLDSLDGNEVREPLAAWETNQNTMPPIDRDLLQQSIEVVELLCQKRKLKMDSARKAKVITLIYTISLEERKIDDSVCYQLLDLAS